MSLNFLLSTPLKNSGVGLLQFTRCAQASVVRKINSGNCRVIPAAQMFYVALPMECCLVVAWAYLRRLRRQMQWDDTRKPPIALWSMSKTNTCFSCHYSLIKVVSLSACRSSKHTLTVLASVHENYLSKPPRPMRGLQFFLTFSKIHDKLQKRLHIFYEDARRQQVRFAQTM